MASTLRTDTFTSSGNWTCPAGVTSATVDVWAAGGGGVLNVGAGGGGAFSSSNRSVNPGSVYAITVGTSSVSSNGGNSSFGSLVVAQGGRAGSSGAGGSSTFGTGDTRTSGGNGELGTGGKFGGGAGHLTNGSGVTGGSPSGGYGIFSNQTVGRIPGGGGASNTTIARPGARGEVRVTYLEEVSDGFPYITEITTGRGGGTSNVISLPTASSGDLIIVYFAGNVNATATASAGWTKLNQTSYTTLATLATFYKVATGSDTLTITTSATCQMSYQAFLIKNAGTPTMTTTSGNSTNATAPTHSIGSVQKTLWFNAVAWNASTPVNVTSAPTGYNSLRIQSDFSPSVGGAVLGTAVKFSQASSESPSVFVSSTEQWVAGTIAIPGVATSSVNRDNFFLML